MNKYWWCFGGFILFVLAGCDARRVFEADYDFPSQRWHKDSIPHFSFRVEDVSPKDIILKIRNSFAFPYRNCYITYLLEDSTGATLKSGMINLQLFDEQTGKPFGRGNTIFQHAEPILQEFNFPKKGQYRLKLLQYMRSNYLKGTYSVGIRVEYGK